MPLRKVFLPQRFVVALVAVVTVAVAAALAVVGAAVVVAAAAVADRYYILKLRCHGHGGSVHGAQENRRVDLRNTP